MLKYCLVLLGLISVFSVQAQQVLFVSDSSEHVKDGKPNDLAYYIVEHLQGKLAQRYQFDYHAVSREREWRLIATQSNVCLFNKLPSAERLSNAYFTQHPIIAFAPNRLIIRKNIDIADGLSLSELVMRGLVIGVEDGRSYGSELDAQIAKLGPMLHRGEGLNNATRLKQMLNTAKLDGIIEFTAVLAQNNADFNRDYRVYNLAQSEQPVFGYIACSLSPLGKKLVTEFDAVLSDKATQAFIIEQHTRLLPIAEHALLSQSLATKFAQ